MEFAELILTIQNSVKMLSTLQLISHALPQIVQGSLSLFCSKSKTNKQENPIVKVCQVHLHHQMTEFDHNCLGLKVSTIE